MASVAPTSHESRSRQQRHVEARPPRAESAPRCQRAAAAASVCPSAAIVAISASVLDVGGGRDLHGRRVRVAVDSFEDPGNDRRCDGCAEAALLDHRHHDVLRLGRAARMPTNNDVSCLPVFWAVPVLPAMVGPPMSRNAAYAVPSPLVDHADESVHDDLTILGREAGRADRAVVGGRGSPAGAGRGPCPARARRSPSRGVKSVPPFANAAYPLASCSGVTSTSPCPTARFTLSPGSHNDRSRF